MGEKMTFYCPKCWAEIAELDRTCPYCGYDLENFTHLGYEDKLISALRHPVPERRMMAAHILGELGSEHALPEFQRIIEGGIGDYFFQREILIASAKINQLNRMPILLKAAQSDSTLISSLVKSCTDQ